MGMPAMTNLSMPRCDIEELKGQIEQLKEKNQQLKELLQKCKVAFKIYANEDETCGLEEENKYAKHLLTKIDNAIGEKK